jgi:hypothetical protein
LFQMIFHLLMVMAACFSLLSAQNQDDLKIKEKINVINIEIPVRVFNKGENVKNLTRDDFTLYEGNKRQVINGFYSKSKCIQVQNVNLKPGERLAEGKSRYIVLIFRVTDFTDELRSGINYLFDHIIKPEDQVLAFVNEKTIPMTTSYWKIDRKDLLLEVLRDECLSAHQRLISFFLNILKDLERTQRTLIEDDTYGQNAYFIIEFLRRYLVTWQEYKKKYLVPDLDKYYNFAKHLEKINMEKWIINFYQIEMFPKIQITGRLRQKIETMVSELMIARPEDSVHSQIITRYLENIDKALSVSNDFPVDELTRLMYKVDTTFHSIFMGVEKETLDENLQFQRVSTDIENCLRELTSKTGGALLTTRDLGSALHTIETKEDFYYVLTYAPKNLEKVNKIVIKVKNKKYDLVYDNNFRADYINEYLQKKKAESPTVVMKNLEFKNKTLTLGITDFKMSELSSKERVGKLNIRIQVKNPNDEMTVFDQTRLITAKKEDITLSVTFEWLEKGNYHIIVDVSDLLTGKTTMDFLDSIKIE